MSLPDLLHAVADAHPVPAPPPGLYERAKRAHRRRQLVAGLAILIAVATIALPLVLPPAPAQPAAPGTVLRMPTHVQAAPEWTADVTRAPIERALIAFTLSTSDDRLTLVGSDDQYRTYAVKPIWLLSPDGRALISSDGTQTEVLRLADGTRHTVAIGRPLAWSPDSTQAIFATGLDGKNAELLVVSMPTGAVLWRATLPPGPGAGLSLTAAMAPDNSAIAVQLREKLYLYRPGSRQWERPVQVLQEVAGQLAWTTDGTAIALTHPGGYAALGMIDAATGEKLEDIMGGNYLAYVGSQGNLSAMPAVVAWHGPLPQVNAGNKAIVTLPHDVVTTAAEKTYEIQVASDGVAWRVEEPGPPDGGPALQRYRGLISATGGVSLLGLVLALGLRRLWLAGRSRARWRR
jgi:hypothetical protein